MILSKKEKEKIVIKLANEGKTTRDIAKEAMYPLKPFNRFSTKRLVMMNLKRNKG